jgi:hypothetical protein
MIKIIRSVAIYIIVIILVIIGYISFNAYREKQILGTIKDSLYEYFKNNNSHIAAYDFNISDINIKCRGNNAYIVEFNMLLDANASKEIDKLGVIVYKKDNTWQVKGFGSGITSKEAETYNFRCYN